MLAALGHGTNKNVQCCLMSENKQAKQLETERLAKAK